ncbi:MAG: universal stress protein [Candidatus Bathyarchaeota archaeon]
MSMYSNILVCTDGSKHSEKAIDQAIEIAKKFNSKITLMHVYQPPRALVQMPRYNERILKLGKDRIKKAGLHVTDMPEMGHPAERICEVIGKGKFDLTILGSRGMSEVKSFFMGSTSDKVSHHATCPVLIVR